MDQNNLPVKFHIERLASATKVKISGQIVQQRGFPELQLADGEKLIIDTQEVLAINSVGIRGWVQWLEGVTNGPITFVNTSPVIVDQINIVEHFLPERAEVESFYVRYYCEKCDKPERILYTDGREFSRPGGQPVTLVHPKYSCDKEKCEMRLDVIDGKFFKFLK